MLLSYGWASHPSRHGEGCPAVARTEERESSFERRRTITEFPLAFRLHRLALSLPAEQAMRYVYILRSISCPWRHYVGVTLDPDRRLAEHNAGMSPHTSKYRPWSIIVAIRFEDDARAFGFEKYLKSPSGRAFAKKHL
jgi:putative endonuclease